MVNVLVVGSGSREHALCWALAHSDRLGELYCAPGNGGTAGLATNLPIRAEAIDDLVELAVARAVDLVIVGPEAPLVDGLVDRLHERGIAAFGPTAAAARIEGSKAWTKALLQRIGVPTAQAQVVGSLGEARHELQRLRLPIVIKADGLAAGKGVTIVQDQAAADAVLDELFVSRTLGSAADVVLLEEYLSGRELSVLAFCDGEHLAIMPPARDYKAAFDGDRGPNTGGMGAYSRPAFADSQFLDQVRATILEPTVRALADDGTPFQGVLYAGLMLTRSGPKVLEFNCRFGDPETQVILPLLESDLLEIAQAVVDGALRDSAVRWRPGLACGVVLASAGYPGRYETGRQIEGLTDVGSDALVFVGGAERAADGGLETSGGRVLTVVGSGADLQEARGRAYTAADKIRFDGRQMRSDIAADEPSANSRRSDTRPAGAA